MLVKPLTVAFAALACAILIYVIGTAFDYATTPRHCVPGDTPGTELCVR
jgi:hypothetical protein